MRPRAPILAVLLTAAACTSGPKITYDFDPTADLNSYSTYSWAYSAAPHGMNPLLYQRVKESIDRTMRDRGYTLREPAQFALAFTVGRRDRVEVTDLGSYGPYYRGWSGWGTSSYSTLDINNVTDGTLMIDIYDTNSRKPVWHGTATKQIRPEQVDQALIDDVVAKVLAKFPPSGS